MTYEQKQWLKSVLTTSLISAGLTAIFMYFFYYQGWQSVAAGLCIGFTIPWAVSFYAESFQKKYLSKSNLIVVLLTNTIVHALIIFGVAVVFVLIFYMRGQVRWITENYRILYSQLFVTGVGFGLLLALFFNFFSILNTLIGRRLLGKFFLGIYRKPFEVDRVFMFLDIKSSTTIAEKIGHLKFLSLVNDFFYDIDEPVKQTKGEIYKYVGDEAIITWKTIDAIKNTNCLHCYELIEKAINRKSNYYLKKYGIVPEFKAGLHGGIAVTGELGFTKREIAYMGDVLNTTARIEEACKQYDKDILMSEDIIKLFSSSSELKFTPIGEVALRGKEEKLKLYTV